MYPVKKRIRGRSDVRISGKISAQGQARPHGHFNGRRCPGALSGLFFRPKKEARQREADEYICSLEEGSMKTGVGGKCGENILKI